MIAYAIFGFAVLIVLLAMQFRLVLRIWSRLRWTHPSVHELGAVLAPTRKTGAPTLLAIENYAAKKLREAKKQDHLAEERQQDD